MTEAMLTAPTSRCPQELAAAIRSAVSTRGDWDVTARRVGEALRRHPPRAEVLTRHERFGHPAGYRSHVLHVEPDGTFSVVAMVWLPGQVTPIHDHVSWCVTAVVQGTEYEEVFTLSSDGASLRRFGSNINPRGEVSFFAPPGDIHRVRNRGSDVAISVHVYGADISRLGSSIRNIYDLPVTGFSGT
ncbi:MAG TPA: cysteine dioxygenase family protein [Streptosporangiaceae bacterium]|nr:cysteine dioxygenase family protein [Streptosporangiaceae bacterium]